MAIKYLFVYLREKCDFCTFRFEKLYVSFSRLYTILQYLWLLNYSCFISFLKAAFELYLQK